MNRPIKFRCWQPSGNRWVYFHIPFQVGDCMPSNVEYEKFCQFTGLNDKNGREIYEGDIVGQAERIGKVVFGWGMFHIDAVSPKELNGIHLAEINNAVEVVGNV